MINSHRLLCILQFNSIQINKYLFQYLMLAEMITRYYLAKGVFSNCLKLHLCMKKDLKDCELD